VFVESDGTAVEAVVAVIQRQLIRVAVQREATTRDAIRIASYGCAENGRLLFVVGDRVIAERNSVEPALAIRSFQRLQGCYPPLRLVSPLWRDPDHNQFDTWLWQRR
jgi:hypothetical protein